MAFGAGPEVGVGVVSGSGSEMPPQARSKTALNEAMTRRNPFITAHPLLVPSQAVGRVKSQLSSRERYYTHRLQLEACGRTAFRSRSGLVRGGRH